MDRFVLLFILSCCVGITSNAQKKNTAEVIKFEKLNQLISSANEDIKVINFWATWCAPCVKELPYFEELPKQVNGRKIKVTLITIDFIEKLDVVNSFIDRKNMSSEVLLLDEIDYNSWIDKVDRSWSGAIPATLVVDSKSGKRKFIEGELTEDRLNTLLKEFTKL